MPPQVWIPMVVAFVVSVVVAVATKMLAPKPKKPGISYYGDYAGTSEPVRIIYGQVRIGGMHVIPPFSTGAEGKFLHVVIAYCAHQIEKFARHYFDNSEIDPATLTAITGTLNDGKVGSGHYDGAAWIRGYTGTSTQTADYILTQAFTPAFTADFRGRGIAYVAYQIKFGNQYKSVPQFGALVYGKMCYDPRTGLTPATATTNPALHLRDYLINEVGFPSTAVDDSLCQAAANICDQLVDIPPGATQQKRYQCNVMLSSGGDWDDNVKILLATMRGHCVYRDGVWRMYAGAWDAPTVTINEGDWVDETAVTISAPVEDRWNAVAGFYMDAARAYQRNSCFIRRNTVYETEDGERLQQDMELHGVTNEYEAQRHSEFELRRSRNQLSITGKLRPEFIKLATWDTVYVNDSFYGWSSKSFRVVMMEMLQTGDVQVSLQEEGSASWTDLARAEYGAVATEVLIDPGASLPSERTGFTITPAAGSLTFRWDVTSDAMPNEVTRLLERSVSSDAVGATEIWRGNASAVNLAFPTVSTKAYWIQGAVDTYAGAYTPNTFGLYAAANSAGSGAAGINALTGYLTNEYTSVPASSNGFVAADAYGGINGTMVLMSGVNSVNVNSINYSIVSNSGTLTSVISPAGTYVVSAGLDTAEPYGALLLRGLYDGSAVDRWFKVGKQLGGQVGSAAYGLSLRPTAQTFRYSGSQTNVGVSTIGFDALLQNLSGTVGFYANNYRADGTLLSSYDLSGTGNTGRGLHINSFTQSNSTAYTVVVASLSGGYTDRVTVQRVQEGAGGIDGTNGQHGMSVALSLPAITLASSVNGTVADYGPANGRFVLTQVTSDVSSYATFAVASNAGCTGELNNADNTPWAGQTKGAYRVTAVTSGTGVLHMTAVHSGITYLRSFSVAKAIAGQNAELLTLISEGQSFKYSGSSTNIGVSTIGFEAVLRNITGTAAFYANNYRADGTLIASYDLSGTGNSGRGLHINSFTSNNSTSYCTVVASVFGGYTDRLTVVRLQDGGQGNAGVDGLVSYLTNENHTIPASSDGTVTNYGGANGAMVMMLGINSVNVNSIAFAVNSNPQTLTNVFSTNGTFAVTGGLDAGESGGLLYLRGTYNASTHEKIFTLAKSIGGTIGAVGSAGTPGGLGPPGANILTNGDFSVVNSIVGRVAAWDYSSTAHSYSSAGGPDGGRCLYVGSNATPPAYWNEVLIPVDPLNEQLDVEVWIRSVNSGHRIAVAMDCVDQFGAPILLERDVLMGYIVPCSNANVGASAIYAYKPAYASGDQRFPGYKPNSGYVVLTTSQGAGATTGAEGWPAARTFNSSVSLITAINTAASNSYDILTLGATLATTVSFGVSLGYGERISPYRYLTGTYATVGSAWTKISQSFRGQPAPVARLNVSAINDLEFGTFRTHARKVRFGIVGVSGGTIADYLAANFTVRRRAFIAGTLVHDPVMIMGGGAWDWQNYYIRNNSYSAMPIQYSPTSGNGGGGMLVFKAGSAGTFTGINDVRATPRDF